MSRYTITLTADELHLLQDTLDSAQLDIDCGDDDGIDTKAHREALSRLRHTVDRAWIEKAEETNTQQFTIEVNA
jgi:hypothetical protein